MKATLVGMIGDRKLYYIIDAGQGDNDCAVVTPSREVFYGKFFSVTTKTTGLKRFKKTPLQKFLWAGPSGSDKKIWFETFVSKQRELDKRFIDTSIIQTSLDTNSVLAKSADARINRAFDNGFEPYQQTIKYKIDINSIKEEDK